MFISLDGADGVGKSTQLELLRAWLVGRGHSVVTCRDPGATALGEKIRHLLLHAEDVTISRTSELLLYMAARAQLVAEVIRPALELGKTVLSDRYLLASVVYQGHAGGLDTEDIWSVGRVATGDLGQLQGKGTRVVKVPIELDLWNAAGVVAQAVQGGSAPVELDAQLQVGGSTVPIDVNQVLRFLR